MNFLDIAVGTSAAHWLLAFVEKNGGVIPYFF